MPTIVLISAAGHVALAGVYNYLPLLPILYFLLPSASTSERLGSFPGGAPHTLIPHGAVPFGILPGLGCYSSPLTLITGHGSTQRHPEGSPALQT